jgi:hypothetical protein
MRFSKPGTVTVLFAVALLTLAVVGCSSEAPLSPTNPDASMIELGASEQNPSAEAGTPGALVGASNPARDASVRVGQPAGGEAVEVQAEFLGLIGMIDVENSTISLFNQDDNFAMVLGHVTEATLLLDGDGNPVSLEAFFACSSANVSGNEIGENEMELISVQMIPF